MDTNNVPADDDEEAHGLEGHLHELVAGGVDAVAEEEAQEEATKHGADTGADPVAAEGAGLQC